MNQYVPPKHRHPILHKKGSTTYQKMSFPIHCGEYSEFETDKHIFHFNLNHEVIRIKDKTGSWNHPHEWLQRTIGNDWLYYSTGGYTGVVEATGEYYLPNFRYSSNSVLGGNPFASTAVSDIIDNWFIELQTFSHTTSTTQVELDPLSAYLENDPENLCVKAKQFHEIIGGQISVLPPDARHVGYNLIPILISRGCLYKCRFCKVKNKHSFQELNHSSIDAQIELLKKFYGPDLNNYNSIYLGEHDALNTSTATILYSIEQAQSCLNLKNSYLKGSNCFLFGSVTSLLESSEMLYSSLQQLNTSIYINVGLESPDQNTLDHIGKPITSAMVQEAFQRIQSINKSYSNIEITVNLLMDENLPVSHYQKTEALLRNNQTFQQNKGTVYFSPLSFDSPSRSRLFEFNRLKLMSRYPTFLYIIQRL